MILIVIRLFHIMAARSADERVSDLVAFKMKLDRNKFKVVFGVLCRKVLSQGIKGMVCKTCVGNAMCYGAEAVP